MTAPRYDAMTPRKGRDGKTYWTKIGSMWPAKDGKDGFNLQLDALPLPGDDGRCTVSMFVPKPKDEQTPQANYYAEKAGERKADPITSGRSRNDDMNDDIPF
jgi:hypothetical protein